MLIFASWSEKFRAEVGLKGASQVWGLRPAWYIWLEHSPGVYHLELLDAGAKTLNGSACCTALFTIKCYPYPQSGHFQTFSFLERKLIQSQFFDDTNTPAFEYQDQIPPDLFRVSTLEMTMSHDDSAALFCFETLDRLCTRYARKTNATYPSLNLDRNFEKGEIDRNVSGLEIGNPLIDCLLCLFGNASKRTPQHIQCSRFGGFEIKLQGGKASVKRSDRINGYRLRVLYTRPNDRAASELMQTNSLAGGNPRPDILYDRTFARGYFHEQAGPKHSPITINPQWWQVGQTRYQSELASTCGCH
jgi:hypothetical protein